MDTQVLDELHKILTPDQLLKLQEVLQGVVVKEETRPVDQPLEKPIMFYSPRNVWLRFPVEGRRKMEKFLNGKYLAKTQFEAEACRRLSSPVFEGEDLRVPQICSHCKSEFMNSQAYQWHMNRHAE
jgi:hypothetical protein